MLFSASILSDVKHITAVFLLGYEQKPNTHPAKISYFLVFSLFLKAWKIGLTYFHSGGGECFSTNDNDNFSLLSDTVVKQHGFYCAAIHVILSFRPQLPLSVLLLHGRASLVVFGKADDQNHAPRDYVVGKNARQVLWLDLQNTLPPWIAYI